MEPHNLKGGKRVKKVFITILNKSIFVGLSTMSSPYVYRENGNDNEICKWDSKNTLSIFMQVVRVVDARRMRFNDEV